MPPTLQPHPHECSWHLYDDWHSPTCSPHPRWIKHRRWCNLLKQFHPRSKLCPRPYHIPISTPSIAAGGPQKMITSPVRARQPLRQAWTCERLLRERTMALGQAIDNSTWKNYGSALNSYLNFIKLHNFPSNLLCLQLCSGTPYIARLQTPTSNPNFSQTHFNFRQLRNSC